MRQVLVADDDLGTRETLSVTLRHAGYDVYVADCGSAALTKLSCGAGLHALLLDLQLGDMTGYDVLRWMRDQSVSVPTAVMTAFRADFDPDVAIALGALAYADQLLSIDDVLGLVATLMAPPSPRDDPLQLHTRFSRRPTRSARLPCRRLPPRASCATGPSIPTRPVGFRGRRGDGRLSGVCGEACGIRLFSWHPDHRLCVHDRPTQSR